MKKSLIKNLLERRVPQIIGSYFVGSTTLILFIDWLITKYGFSENILAFTWFGLISILPSVLILAYFHGAPGKDEWTRVEKFGIPLNILFIAIALFTGYKFNAWQDPPPDHSKVYDSFMVHVSSNQNNIDQLKLTEFYLENVGMKYLGGAIDYIDSIYPIDNEELERIRRYVNVNVNKEFMNYEDITINYPENQKELDMMDSLVSAPYLEHIGKYVNDEELERKKEEEVERYIRNYDYFSSKHDTYIDKILNIKIYTYLLNKKGKLVKRMSGGGKSKGDVVVCAWTINAITIKANKGWTSRYLFEWAEMGEGTPIEQYIYESIVRPIKYFTFGANIGEIVNIIDSNLVTIKLTNLDLIKGSDLIFRGRRYPNNYREESLKRYIEDNNTMYNYFYKHPDQIENLDHISDHASNDDWLKREKKMIDSLETNFQTIIDNNYQGLYHYEFRYYLRILNIQDSIATAKITGSVFPFAKPMIGDKINIK